MSALIEGVFELGKVLLETELSKHETRQLLRSDGATATERVVLQKIGKFWNQQNMWDRPDGLVVVTTHRLVFLAKVQSITATTEFLSFPFTAMANLKTARVMGVSPAVQFEAAGKTFIFTLFSGAADVIGAIQEQRAA
ncbi:MAG: hypothetical protein ACT4OF_14120 [Caulobacteraceae bacterium]